MSRRVRARCCALFLSVLLVGAFSVAAAPPVAAAENRAVVIVGGGAPVVISFSGTINGITALQLAGANVVTLSSGGGAAVCKINGVGNEPSSMNVCLGSESNDDYWSYWLAERDSTGFSYSPYGGSVPVVGDGDVVGWRYGGYQAPAFSSFCSVAGCAPPPTDPPAPAPTPAPAPGNGSAAAPSGASGPVDTSPVASPSGVDATAAPVVTTQPEPVVSTTGPRTDGRRGQALGVPLPGGEDDGGSGSPWGLAVALGLAVAVAVAAVVLRRRRAAAGAA